MFRFTLLSCLLWLLCLIAHALAAGLHHTTTTGARGSALVAAAPLQHLQARQQSAGAACSDEGQWNCMTSSWQRCAAGRWSVTMPCARGTTCYPAGLTRDFRIQHDGSVNGKGGTPTTSGVASRGATTRRWTSRLGILACMLGCYFC